MPVTGPATGPTSATRPSRPPSTPLATVAGWVGATIEAGLGAERPGGSVVVTGLTLSSQRVRPGDLYAALPGHRAHGAGYAVDAVRAGAVAVLTDAEGARICAEAGVRVPVLVVPHPREVLGRLASSTYGDPAERLTVLGVTGTQGKTTTTRLLENGLTGAGVTSAVIGTVGTRIAGEDVKTALTTPEAPDLHGLFALMAERGVRAVAMEVSSHALVMGRVDGVVFDVAAFLNLGRDHLDFHPTMADYFAAKASLFTPERASRGLTNVDDEHGRRLLEIAGIPMRTFSASGAEADWRAVDVDAAPERTDFVVVGPDGARHDAGVPLAGGFNVANALCAVALAGEAGYDVAAVAAALSHGGGVPGRLERVDAGQPFLAVVDYAHKPDALDAALRALRPQTAGRLILVVGAGGERDTGKRPLMGEIGARLADVLVVTDDNPRSEDPAAIRAEVLAGAHAVAGSDVREIGDRREAIRAAVALARTGDTVIVAGKGHETGQEIAGTVYPFDDRDEVRAALGDALGEDRPEGTQP